MTDTDEIRNLLGAYCHAADDQRFSDYAELFAHDGVLVEEGRTIPHDKLAALGEAFVAATADEPQPNGLKHLTMNTIITVDGDSGHAISDLLVLQLKPDTGWRISGCGRYIDDVVRHGGRWLIQRREVTWFKNIPRAELEPEFGNRLSNVFDDILGTTNH